jgi:hypothetical protein
MFGIQPKQLTDEELLKYARLFGADALDRVWVEELLNRLEKHLQHVR